MWTIFSLHQILFDKIFFDKICLDKMFRTKKKFWQEIFRIKSFYQSFSYIIFFWTKILPKFFLDHFFWTKIFQTKIFLLIFFYDFFDKKNSRENIFWTTFFDKNHDILGFEFTFSIIRITFIGSGIQTERHWVPWLGQIE